MRRRQWFEIHDQSWFPTTLRDLVTGTLQFIWNSLGFYEPILHRLHQALAHAASHQVLDLCSGAGGPWLRLVRDLEVAEGFPVQICLTDKFPNTQAFAREQIGLTPGIAYDPQPVDATCVPEHLQGFRTLFSSFHHFPPKAARAILQDAVRQQRGIAIFEVPRRDVLTIFMVFFVPLVALVFAPFIKPFRWSRLVWTMLIPVVPFVLWFDGVVSCLRAYTPAELRNLANGSASAEYHWEAGEEKHPRLPVAITYLIGYLRHPPE